MSAQLLGMERERRDREGGQLLGMERERGEIGRVSSCGKEGEKQSKCLGTMAVCWSGGQSTFCMLDSNASLIG